MSASDAFSLALAQRRAIPTRQEALSTHALVTLCNLHSSVSFGCPSAAFKFLYTMFDSEKFICEVETCPPLYNVQLKEYSNREVKGEMLVNFLYVGFSLCKMQIVELTDVSVLKNVVCSGFL